MAIKTICVCLIKPQITSILERISIKIAAISEQLVAGGAICAFIWFYGFGLGPLRSYKNRGKRQKQPTTAASYNRNDC